MAEQVSDSLYDKIDPIVAHLFEHQPEPGTPEETLFVAMCEYMHAHEQTHHRLPAYTPTPVEVIEYQLDRLGWTQAELAERAQIQKTHLSSVLGGKRSLSLNQAKKLAVLFGVSLDRLITNEFRTQIEPVRAAGQ